MKKIFTLIAAAAATLMASAADFQLYIGDSPVTDGQTYELGYKINSYETSQGTYGYVVQDADLFFHGNVGTSLSVKVDLETKDCTLAVCSLDGNCTVLGNETNVYTVTKVGALKSAVQSAEIHSETMFMGQIPEVPEIVFKVSATCGNSTTTCTIKLLSTPAAGSVKGIAASNDYIKAAAGNVLNYSVSAPTTLAVYAITGNLVAKYPIADTGSVSLGTLPAGIYIYTAGTHKGKMVIR